ncbi:MAG: PhzF family phenazine biosynthesis protein [Gemmataceae bacterium]
MTQPFLVVDAFTSQPFQGNPAAVVPLDRWPSDAWLQNVAMEMNHAETAFLVPAGSGHHLRWFTPAVEDDLCGHATLAAAKALDHLNLWPAKGPVRFQTRSGELRVNRQGSQFELDFPVLPPVPCPAPPNLLQALAATPVHIGKNSMDYLVELPDEKALRDLRPDLKLLGTVPCRGVIVTAPSDNSQFDCVSRFFAPAVGVDEDPVTGSAHCCLAEFWSKKTGKHDLIGNQASRRGGIVTMRLRENRVFLGGQAVVVSEGKLLVNPQ